MTAAATTAPAACNLLPFISISFFKAMTPLARYNITPRGADYPDRHAGVMKRTDGKYGGGSRERDRIAVRHTRRRIGGISLGLRRHAPGVRAELAPTGTLRVAVFTGNPVLGTRDKASGEVTGTTVTMGRALAARAGVPAKIIEYTAIAKLVEDAKTGEWDIAVVAFDPARRNLVDFAPPHIVVDLTYLVAPGSTIGSVAEADKAGVNIAAARGAATTLYLQRELKQAQVVQAENEPAAFNLIKEGKAQVYAQNRYMLLGLAENFPGARVLED